MINGVWLSAVIISHSQVHSCHGENTSCSCKSKLQETLRKHFGISSFRPGQTNASLSVLHGKDVFVRMAMHVSGSSEQK